MDGTVLLLLLGFTIACANAAAVAACTAVGAYWVKSNKHPQWVTGRTLHVLHFFDGVEYLLSRGALATSMVRDLLKFKLMQSHVAVEKKAAPVVDAAPLPPPPLPAAVVYEADVASLADEILASTTTSVRKRPKILPPGSQPVVV